MPTEAIFKFIANNPPSNRNAWWGVVVVGSGQRATGLGGEELLAWAPFQSVLLESSNLASSSSSGSPCQKTLTGPKFHIRSCPRKAFTSSGND